MWLFSRENTFVTLCIYFGLRTVKMYCLKMLKNGEACTRNDIPLFVFSKKITLRPIFKILKQLTHEYLKSFAFKFVICYL